MSCFVFGLFHFYFQPAEAVLGHLCLVMIVWTILCAGLLWLFVFSAYFRFSVFSTNFDHFNPFQSLFHAILGLLS